MEFLRNRKQRRLVIGGVIAVVVLFLYIDDWGRDFIRNEASISEQAEDETLRPLTSTSRSQDEMIEAVKMGARRIRNWSYIGEAEDGDTMLITFERTNRLLRFTDDITIRIEDRDGTRVVTGESHSRIGIGDLGRNPRNLRRLLHEMRTVLDGAARITVLTPPLEDMAQ